MIERPPCAPYTLTHAEFARRMGRLAALISTVSADALARPADTVNAPMTHAEFGPARRAVIDHLDAMAWELSYSNIADQVPPEVVLYRGRAPLIIAEERNVVEPDIWWMRGWLGKLLGRESRKAS